jgi:hypothetical protein
MRVARGPAGTPCLGVVILLLAAQGVTAQTTVLVEYRTNANFLAPFGSFNDWLGGSFPAAEAPFLVCTVSDLQFGTSLSEVTRNASPRDRRVQVRWIQKEQDLRGYHILFVSSSESKWDAKDQQAVPGADVLTVGEKPDFLTVRGALSLSFQNGALQFEVNLLAANEAYPRVSTRLSARARRVVNNRECSKA